MEGKKRLSSNTIKYGTVFMLLMGIVALAMGALIAAIIGIVLCGYALATFYDVYYDNDKLYLKRLSGKEYIEVDIDDVYSIDKYIRYSPIGRSFINIHANVVLKDGHKFPAFIRLELSSLSDLLDYIKTNRK
jgi:hypothetical protein